MSVVDYEKSNQYERPGLKITKKFTKLLSRKTARS